MFAQNTYAFDDSKSDRLSPTTREALSDSLGVVGDNLSALNDLTNSSGDLLVDDMEGIPDIFSSMALDFMWMTS